MKRAGFRAEIRKLAFYVACTVVYFGLIAVILAAAGFDSWRKLLLVTVGWAGGIVLSETLGKVYDRHEKHHLIRR